MLRRPALALLPQRASKLFLALVAVGLIWTAGAPCAAADQRFVVRTVGLLDGGPLGSPLQPADIVGNACALAGCTVRYTLDGQIGRLFLVTTGDGVDAQAFLNLLSGQPGISNAEIDQVVQTLGDQSGGTAPPALYDRTPVAFYGAPVWHGYLEQPAAHCVGIANAQNWFGLTGSSVTVAVIDTGVDPDHPVLKPVVLSGYDFTRNLTGGSEWNDVDVTQSTMAVVDQAYPVFVNQSTMAVVDQSTMAVVDDEAHAAFGHGTMVAGVIHLVAPEAWIMPLKAFSSDGRGYSSDILRALYYAVEHGAKVVNLSFSYEGPSAELASAVQYAISNGVLVVASAGNTGQHAPAYPGSLPQVVGVASTNDADAISGFSNYGEDLFWIAAPGEAIVTTYPFGTYAATWGTSFSAPFAAGTAALLAQFTAWIDQEQARAAVGSATPIAGVARGRLDASCAVSSQAIPGSPCTPSINWSNPANIAYGTSLSTAQLNATANVPGTFTYTPAAGTILSAGTGQTLRVAFTPTHTAIYAPTSASVSINVLKATPTITWTTPADIVDGTALSNVQLNATASVPGTLAYTPPAGTVLTVGAGQTLSVTFTPADTANYTGATASVAINVKATPTITWTTPAEIVYGTALGAAQLNATASVPGTFTYTPAAGAVLTAGGGQILRVAFTPTDAANYFGATASVAINVLKATPTLTWTTPADIVYRTALGATQLNATASVSGTFTYTPAAGTVLTAGSAQTLGVAFTPTDTANYTGAAASVVINVSRATPTLTWTTPADIAYGTALDATQLNATASVPGTFAYTPATGTVLTVGSGHTLSVAFTPTDTANYSTAAASVAINVKATPTLTWTTPADIVYGTALGAAQLNATASVPGTFTYTPAAGAVLTAGGGQILRVAFTPTDAANYFGATASVAINVLKATPTITWTTPADIVYGTALGATQLNATASVPGTFTYTPAAGTVLIAGGGQTLHVAFTPTDTNYTAAAMDVPINVSKATPSITWSTPADIVDGTALSNVQLNATASVPGTLAYTPPAGTVLTVGAGQTLSVTFTPADTANYTGATASVAINVKATPTLTWTTSADIVYGTALGATQLNATASVPGTFTYTPAAGTILSAGTGQTLHVTFTPSDPNYSAAAMDVQINVLKATPTITWTTPADIVYGTALGATQLNATASVPGTFTYTPAAGMVLNAGTGQTLHVTFTPTDTNYTAAAMDVQINVSKATPSITWSTPADIVDGTPLCDVQLNATASVPGTLAYTPPAGTVLNVGSGHTLSVIFTPTDTANYNGGTASVLINVTPNTPAGASDADPNGIG